MLQRWSSAKETWSSSESKKVSCDIVGRRPAFRRQKVLYRSVGCFVSRKGISCPKSLSSWALCWLDVAVGALIGSLETLSDRGCVHKSFFVSSAWHDWTYAANTFVTLGSQLCTMRNKGTDRQTGQTDKWLLLISFTWQWWVGWTVYMIDWIEKLWHIFGLSIVWNCRVAIGICLFWNKIIVSWNSKPFLKVAIYTYRACQSHMSVSLNLLVHLAED
jgi:hypothetical protein